jgi:hypothetical protein
MDDEDAKKYLKEARPALFELSSENTKESALTRAIDAFVELEPNLNKCRDQVAVVIVATVVAFQREREKYPLPHITV